MKPRPTNPNLSEAGRKLLREMNGANYPRPEYHDGLLENDSTEGTWWRAGKRIKAEIADELIRLCAVKTKPGAVWPLTQYVVSDEGNKLLTMPDYVPVMVRQQNSRCREKQKA